MAETEIKVDAEETTVTEAVDTKKEDKKDKKKVAKANKPGIGARILKFFKDLLGEMKKISWYGKKQLLKSTVLVIVCLVVVAGIIFVVDLGLNKAILWLASLI